MIRNYTKSPPGIHVSVAVFAWNEEYAIRGALESLFGQTIFQKLSRRQLSCEVLCMLNGCTDRTAAVAEEFFAEQRPRTPAVQCRVVDLSERGKLNAWNHFVHVASARETRFLVMMDADINIHRPATLWRMLSALAADAEASVAVDRPRKHLEFKSSLTLPERLSLRASGITASAEAQLCAQLYCIRAEVARNIYLPKDLPACEDGFLKAAVCTDFLAHAPNPRRITVAPEAEHTFEAYTSPLALLKNQKRQVLGQTVVRLLIDHRLKQLPFSARQRMAETLRELETNDPLWLKRLIAEHVARVRLFWRVCPGYISTTFKRWRRLDRRKKITGLPAVLAGTVLALCGSFLAFRALKQGAIDYWPKAQRNAGNSFGAPLTAPREDISHSMSAAR